LSISSTAKSAETSTVPTYGPIAPSRHAPSIAARLERLPLTSFQRGIFLIIATAWFFDSLDLGALTFLLGSIRTEWGLSVQQAGLLSSTGFLGMFVGAAASGLLADRFGRSIVLQLSIVAWGIGGLCCGLAPDVLTFGLARLLVGLGMGMEFPVAQALVSEFMPAKRRGQYIAYLEGLWPVGFVVSGLVCLAALSVANWHWAFIIESLPAVFVFVVRRRIPESPRWLAARGQHARADAVLSSIESEVRSRPGGAPLPEPSAELGEQEGSTGFAALWAGGYARRTAMLWVLWFMVMLGYYGLTTWLGALLQQGGFAVTKSVYYTILISLAGVPGFVFAGWLVEHWGRRPSCATMLIAAAASAYLYRTASGQAALIAFGLCMQFFLFGMWCVVYAYTPELYPTRMRATGSGFASAIGRVGALLGPYLVGTLLPLTGQAGIFALAAGAFVLAGVVVLAFGEETRGRALEEISP